MNQRYRLVDIGRKEIWLILKQLTYSANFLSVMIKRGYYMDVEKIV